MSDISKIDITGTELDIKDATARDQLTNLGGTDDLSTATVGSNTQPVYLYNGVLTVSTDTGSYNTALGSNANINGSYCTAIGNKAVCDADYCTTLGYNAEASNYNYNTAIGALSCASNDGTVAIGAGAIANCTYATAVGRKAQAANTSAVAIGWGANASGNTSIAIGQSATAPGDCSVSIGRSSNASGNYSLCLGRGTAATADYASAIGATSSCANANGMQLGNSGLSSLTCKVSLTTTSDIRDKADVTNLDDGATEFLRAVKAIRYVYNGRVLYLPEEEDQTEEDKDNLAKFGICAYDTEAWESGTKKGSRIRIGFSAQEVQEAIENVYGDASYINLVNDNLYDFDQDSIPEGIESQLAMNYEGFIPVIVKAFQELDARVTVLEESV